MTFVFVSHCSEDNYFVDFLAELLRFHHVAVWVDRTRLEAGANFTVEIEQALRECDMMIVVISEHAVRSQWVVREVSHFRAVASDRPVIPLVLDSRADPDRIYEGLGLITQLRCYESLLDSLRKLMELLGRTLFPDIDGRILAGISAYNRDHHRPASQTTSPVPRISSTTSSMI